MCVWGICLSSPCQSSWQFGFGHIGGSCSGCICVCVWIHVCMFGDLHVQPLPELRNRNFLSVSLRMRTTQGLRYVYVLIYTHAYYMCIGICKCVCTEIYKHLNVRNGYCMYKYIHTRVPIISLPTYVKRVHTYIHTYTDTHLSVNIRCITYTTLVVTLTTKRTFADLHM